MSQMKIQMQISSGWSGLARLTSDCEIVVAIAAGFMASQFRTQFMPINWHLNWKNNLTCSSKIGNSTFANQSLISLKLCSLLIDRPHWVLVVFALNSNNNLRNCWNQILTLAWPLVNLIFDILHQWQIWALQHFVQFELFFCRHPILFSIKWWDVPATGRGMDLYRRPHPPPFPRLLNFHISIFLAATLEFGHKEWLLGLETL